MAELQTAELHQRLEISKSRIFVSAIEADCAAYTLRTTGQPWGAGGLQITKTGRRHELVTTQGHHTMAGRPLVRSGTLEQFREHPEFVHEMGHEPPPDLSLYPEHKFDGSAWAMVINTDVCIGCNACVVACQAKNNIPVVGKEEVARGREMLWLRVDRYYHGPAENPDILFQEGPAQLCHAGRPQHPAANHVSGPA